MIFTIEHWLKEFNRTDAPLANGARFKTTRDYTGDSECGTGVITGRMASPSYEVSDFLQERGFRHHEVYTVTLDNGETTVMWPEEIETASAAKLVDTV